MLTFLIVLFDINLIIIALVLLNCYYSTDFDIENGNIMGFNLIFPVN